MIADDVLHFWFDGDRHVFRERWFRADESFDTECRERFEFMVRAAMDGALDGWAATAEGALALVIVLDQFPRNMFRGSHLAYAGDAHARRIARAALADGFDTRLTPMERLFLYIPFEHSEDLADQDLAVSLFATLGDAEAVGSAERHRAVVRRFGRFPHRNAALGRAGTPEEEAWLAEPGPKY